MPAWLPGWMFHFAQWLDQSSFGHEMRESLYLFPIIETLHVFGIVSLVSSAFCWIYGSLAWARCGTSRS